MSLLWLRMRSLQSVHLHETAVPKMGDGIPKANSSATPPMVGLPAVHCACLSEHLAVDVAPCTEGFTAGNLKYGGLREQAPLLSNLCTYGPPVSEGPCCNGHIEYDMLHHAAVSAVAAAGGVPWVFLLTAEDEVDEGSRDWPIQQRQQRQGLLPAIARLLHGSSIPGTREALTEVLQQSVSEALLASACQSSQMAVSC